MRYLIVDLDDTLLRKDKTVSDYTKAGIEKLRKEGFLFVFNTARGLAATEECIEELKPDYSILNGGAMICDRDRNVLFKKEISVLDTNFIIKELMKDGEVELFWVQTQERLLSNDMDRVNKRIKFEYFDFASDLNEPSMKIVISSPNPDKWEQMAKDMGYEFERYLNGTWFRISNANKNIGNQELFKILGDEAPMDYVFGDDYGDVEMIQNAYYGALLQNSHMKDVCENITEFDCDNDGVIRHMERILQ